MAEERVRIRLTCLCPPPALCEQRETEFGLQDTDQQVHAGTVQGDGVVTFEAELRFKVDAESGAVRLLGPHVHGTSADRFLYLSYRHRELGAPWIGRIKVDLSAVTPEQVLEAAHTGAVLEAAVSAQKPNGAPAWARVPLLGAGWSVCPA